MKIFLQVSNDFSVVLIFILEEKRRLAWCLDQIEERHDLIHAARCLVQARRRQIILRQKQFKCKKRKTKTSYKLKEAIHHKWIGGFLINAVPKRKIQFKKDSRISNFYPKIQNHTQNKSTQLPKTNLRRVYINRQKSPEISYPIYENATLIRRLDHLDTKNLAQPYQNYQKSDQVKPYNSHRFQKYRMRRRRLRRSLHRFIEPTFTFKNDRFSPEIKIKQMKNIEKISYKAERSPIAKVKYGSHMGV